MDDDPSKRKKEKSDRSSPKDKPDTKEAGSAVIEEETVSPEREVDIQEPRVSSGSDKSDNAGVYSQFFSPSSEASFLTLTSPPCESSQECSYQKKDRVLAELKKSSSESENDKEANPLNSEDKAKLKALDLIEREDEEAEPSTDSESLSGTSYASEMDANYIDDEQYPLPFMLPKDDEPNYENVSKGSPENLPESFDAEPVYEDISEGSPDNLPESFDAELAYENVREGSPENLPQGFDAAAFGASSSTMREADLVALEQSLVPDVQVGSSSKKYECDQCGKLFACQRYLRAHKQSHPREKPFQCKICGGWFRHKRNLTTHEKKIHKIEKKEKILYTCYQCEKPSGFSKEIDFNLHSEEIHSIQKPHFCDECGRCYKSQKILRGHKKHKHHSTKGDTASLGEVKLSESVETVQENVSEQNLPSTENLPQDAAMSSRSEASSSVRKRALEEEEEEEDAYSKEDSAKKPKSTWQ